MPREDVAPDRRQQLAPKVIAATLLLAGLILIEQLYRAGSLEGLRYTAAGLLVAALFFLVKR